MALCFYLSGHLIEKVGDLKTIAVSLSVYCVSFLALSFINIPWLVLVVDILQAAGYAFSYSGINVHFSKLGSKASSGVILGKKATYQYGKISNSSKFGLRKKTCFGFKIKIYFNNFFNKKTKTV